jgi:hypothetical protein
MSTDRPDHLAKVQFEEAVRRLEAVRARVRAVSVNPLADETTRRTAQVAYEEARLLWLSCEAVLRSVAIIDEPTRHPSGDIVIVQGNAHVAESIVRSKDRIEDVVSHRSAAAIIVDIERHLDRAHLLALQKVKKTARTRAIAMVPQALENDDWSGFDAVLVKPASIDLIVQAITSDAGSTRT